LKVECGIWFMVRLPKFHIFLFLYFSSLNLNLFLFFFYNLVGYWNAWNWILNVLLTYIASCFTSLLAHQHFDLVGSLTLLQIPSKVFYEGVISHWINDSLLWSYDIILGMNCEPWNLDDGVWQWAYGFQVIIFYGCCSLSFKLKRSFCCYNWNLGCQDKWIAPCFHDSCFWVYNNPSTNYLMAFIN
jgi:hypothetical protein